MVFLCVGSVIPLLKDSVGILMQRIPVDLEKNVHIAYQRVSFFVCINKPNDTCCAVALTTVLPLVLS